MLDQDFPVDVDVGVDVDGTAWRARRRPADEIRPRHGLGGPIARCPVEARTPSTPAWP
jgi:hypothetical protein